MKSKGFELSFFLYNKKSILIEWPKIISENILEDILDFSNKLSKSKNIDTRINGYNSLLITYKLNIKSLEKEIFNLKNFIKIN
tara:strand:+ start:60 stop:308 length:249 start_codon:yes stop_codon:yes gene_type:complete